MQLYKITINMKYLKKEIILVKLKNNIANQLVNSKKIIKFRKKINYQ